MKITCVSDLHGFYPELEGGDLLIIAGDWTKKDTESQVFDFFDWVHEQDYRKKIIIAGNHDNQAFEQNYSGPVGLMKDAFVYLCDSGTKFEGRKIWGSPWTRSFVGMNPKCRAFVLDTEEELGEKWKLIPTDTDILITHSPPFSVLDKTVDGLQVGSSYLMADHLQRLRPKLWVFGHIHEAYGQEGPFQWNRTKYVNASHVDENYKPVHKPITVDLCSTNP